MAGLFDRDPFLGETDGEAIIHDTGVSERQKRIKMKRNVISELRKFFNASTVYILF